jgi:hypothetical protein
MKVTSFHFMPHRELPDDFDKRYKSAWIDAPWWELANAERVGDFYNWSIDELMLAAKLGFDGLGTNEHHQNAYGFMCNPNLFGAILARMTRDQGLNPALVQLGATISFIGLRPGVRRPHHRSACGDYRRGRARATVGGAGSSRPTRHRIPERTLRRCQVPGSRKAGR